MIKYNNDLIVSNFLWCLFERWGAQGVTFVVSIILARLLEPEMYGVVALTAVFTSILSVFIDSGLGSALVQKKDIDELDYSTVFFFNVMMCIVLYFIVYISAPYIAMFFSISQLTMLVRVSGLSLIVSGVKNILVSVIQRNLMYKKFFYSTLVGTIGAGILGVLMAYNGYGVWALVIQGLFNCTVDTIILWITVGWRPSLVFSIRRLIVLLKFGWKILVATLLNTFYGKMRDLVIGKSYSSVDLAYFNKASGWPNLLFVNIGGAVDGVMYSVMSRAQDNHEEMKYLVSKTIKTNSFILMPMLAGLAAISSSLVELVLTSKWLPIVPYMQIFCYVHAINVVGNTQINAIRSLGRSDLFLKLDIIKKTIDFIAIIITMYISVIAMAVSMIVTSSIGLIINVFVLKKLLNFGIKEQIKNFVSNAVLSMVMLVLVYNISTLHMDSYAKIVIQILLGILSYSILSFILNRNSFLDFYKFFKGKI